MFRRKAKAQVLTARLVADPAASPKAAAAAVPAASQLTAVVNAAGADPAAASQPKDAAKAAGASELKAVVKIRPAAEPIHVPTAVAVRKLDAATAREQLAQTKTPDAAEVCGMDADARRWLAEHKLDQLAGPLTEQGYDKLGDFEHLDMDDLLEVGGKDCATQFLRARDATTWGRGGTPELRNTRPTPADLAANGNGYCADCAAANPMWASISFGVTICLQCAGTHRSIGVHISFVRSIDMDSGIVKIRR